MTRLFDPAKTRGMWLNFMLDFDATSHPESAHPRVWASFAKSKAVGYAEAYLVGLADQVRPRLEKLITWIQKNAPLVRLRPDHRVIVQRVWADDRERLSGVSALVGELAKLAGASSSAATESAPPAARSAAASR